MIQDEHGCIDYDESGVGPTVVLVWILQHRRSLAAHHLALEEQLPLCNDKPAWIWQVDRASHRFRRRYLSRGRNP